MIVDEIYIRIAAGHGGQGKYHSVKSYRTTPTGGNGGRGGSVYVSATSDLSALNKFSGIAEIKAENGERGGDNRSSGKSGVDTDLVFPIGTSVVDLESQRTLELKNVGERILLCKGGLGGRGGDFQSHLGLPGQSIKAKLILKLIAKYGLIGLPNAGKSSLLNELTNAKAQVCAYPFTTLEPNLGVINGQIIADIPGLIEGASDGKGLGVKFLKHIEKVSLLFHCIACNSSNITSDYEKVNSELIRFGQGLDKKPVVIVLTKTDLVTLKDVKAMIKSLRKYKYPVIAVSIYDFESIENLKKAYF